MDDSTPTTPTLDEVTDQELVEIFGADQEDGLVVASHLVMLG